jgi:hypothetical protein
MKRELVGLAPRRLLPGVLCLSLATALGAGCHTPNAEMPKPEDPRVAARQGLNLAIQSLGGEDKGGRVKTAITTFAQQVGAPHPEAGVKESLAKVLQRATFRERGWFASFDAKNDAVIGDVADFVSGEKSPFATWKGWRYRSGVVEENGERKITVVVLDAPLPTEAKPKALQGRETVPQGSDGQAAPKKEVMR